MLETLNMYVVLSLINDSFSFELGLSRSIPRRKGFNKGIRTVVWRGNEGYDLEEDNQVRFKIVIGIYELTILKDMTESKGAISTLSKT